MALFEMKDINLSIVIPTKDRKIYLDHFVDWFVRKDFDAVELVIHDNSSNGENKYVHDISKNNRTVVYEYFKEELTGVDNCDKAVKLAMGEFVCFIGDDDGITEALVNLVKEMTDKDCDSISFSLASYSWPDMKYRFSNESFNGLLKMIKTNKFELNKINVDDELRLLLKAGGTIITQIPRLYHGVVRKSILDKLYNECGTYFPGPVPDMTNAVALTKHVKHHYHVNQSFIISGNGGLSMAAKGASGKHHGAIKDEKTLPEKTDEQWSKKIPKFWSGPTIWAESVHKALEETDRKILLKDFNYSYLIANCICFQPRYYKETLSSFYYYFTYKEKIKMIFPILFSTLDIVYFRAKVFINNRSNKENTSDNYLYTKDIENIEDAIAVVEQKYGSLQIKKSGMF